MTTLTANVSYRADHCVHKLPSSCRLTAKPICCACQDIRPHAPAYRTYIDGAGFVLRGRRQERYCWQCKVFWDRRVEDSGVPQPDTRLPEIPDQTAFINKWFDWHRGYRTINRADGVVEKQAMVGESLAEVDIGCLPRTITDLRNGLHESSDQTTLSTQQQREYRAQQNGENEDAEDDEEVIPEEDRLFDPESSIAELPAEPVVQVPQSNEELPSSIAIDSLEFETLRDEFETAFSETFAAYLPETTRIDLFNTQSAYSRFNDTLAGLSSRLMEPFLLDLEENLHVLDGADASRVRRFITHHLNRLRQTPAQTSNTNSSSNATNTHLLPTNSTSTEADSIGLPTPLDTSFIRTLNLVQTQALKAQFERDLGKLRQRLGYLAPLGTQEDVQDSEYVSPISNLFNNYQAQHQQRQAERQRREQRDIEASQSHRYFLLEQMRREVERREHAQLATTSNIAQRHHQLRPRLGHVFARENIRPVGSQAYPTYPMAPRERSSGNPQPSESNLPMPSTHSGPIASNLSGRNAGMELTDMMFGQNSQHAVPAFPELIPPRTFPGLDLDERPPPLEESELIVSMACAVCYSQLATIALIPCGHCALCKWCQVQAVPSNRLDATQPRDKTAKCPVCRRGVKKMLRIYGPEEIVSRKSKTAADVTSPAEPGVTLAHEQATPAPSSSNMPTTRSEIIGTIPATANDTTNNVTQPAILEGGESSAISAIPDATDLHS